MNKENFSLCIPYYNYVDNKIDNLMWRIADYSPEDKILTQAIYTESYDFDYLPRKLSVNGQNVEIFKPSIYTWFRKEDGIVRSTETKLKPIEIIYLDKDVSLDELRELLYKGIEISNHTSDEFLLIYSKSYKYCEAIFLTKRMSSSKGQGVFQIQKSCTDMLHTTHTTSMHAIFRNDIITTEESKIYQEINSLAPVRYFYCKLETSASTSTFHFRKPKDYAAAFVSKYMKMKSDSINLTNKEKQKLLEMIKLSLNSSKEIKNFFEDTGFDLEDVEKSFEKLSDEVLAYFSGDNAFLSIAESALIKNEELADKYIEVAKTIWLKEADEEKQEITDQLKTLNKSLEHSNEQYLKQTEKVNKKQIQINTLQKDIDIKQNELDSLSLKIGEITTKINQELKNYQTDIVHLAALSAFSNSSADVPNGFIYEQGALLEGNGDVQAEDVIEFCEDLQGNFEISGINSDYSWGIAQCVIGCLISEKNMILNEHSELFCNALSSLIDKSECDKIYCTNTTINLESLVQIINNSQNKVILIYGALNTYSDKNIITLSKLCKDKFIVFECEDIDSFENLPMHWNKYALKLSIADFIDDHKTDDFYSYKLDKSLLSVSISYKDQEINRIIKEYQKDTAMGKSLQSIYNQLLCISKELFNETVNIQKLIMPEQENLKSDLSYSEV